MIPHYFALDDDEKMAVVREQGAGNLVTARPDGTIDSTLLPVVFKDDRIMLHMSRFNEHWRQITKPTPATMIFTGAHGFVNSREYTVEVGKSVASTWDYTQVKIHGTLTVNNEPDFVREAVLALTAEWDADQAESMDERYLARATRAIVGLSMTVDRIEGKAKLSQNKLPQERERIAQTLREQGSYRALALAADIEAAPSKARRVPFLGGLKNKQAS
ncbi:MAG: FMN-binding negative transcriptional regulator [Flaviflexus sp.]|uniref:FMN-binding negative transcriptional regulator n=1 Tax=Flaviflexus sp. TaxID=1969482 RepID=UPI003F936935